MDILCVLKAIGSMLLDALMYIAACGIFALVCVGLLWLIDYRDNYDRVSNKYLHGFLVGASWVPFVATIALVALIVVAIVYFAFLSHYEEVC